MRTLVLFAAVLAVLVYLAWILGAKMIRCPKCSKRAVEVIEATKFWRKCKCRRCGHVFVEETGH